MICQNKNKHLSYQSSNGCKKTNFLFRSDRSSEKNNLSKIEKSGGLSQQAVSLMAAQHS